MGAISDYAEFGFCAQNRYALESLCWYTPEYSSLWHPLVQFPSLTWKTATLAGYCAVVFTYLAAPPVVVVAFALLHAAAGTAMGVVESHDHHGRHGPQRTIQIA